jgi:hypothetical protein
MLKRVAILAAIAFSTGALSTAALSSFSAREINKPVAEEFPKNEAGDR